MTFMAGTCGASRHDYSPWSAAVGMCLCCLLSHTRSVTLFIRERPPSSLLQCERGCGVWVESQSCPGNL